MDATFLTSLVSYVIFAFAPVESSNKCGSHNRSWVVNLLVIYENWSTLPSIGTEVGDS